MAAVTSIMRAQQILLGELDALLRPYGLTFARYEALVLLTFSRRGVLPLGLIGERLMVHPTSATNIIDRLERQQMVVRRPNPADGRGRLAEITEAGRAVVERATRDLMAAVTSIMRAQQILLGELDALLRPYGLTFARYEALVLLTFSRRGALPLGVIGERLMVHPTSVTNIISRLERQQMVVRRPNPADGRGRLAEITDAGRDVVARATLDLMAAEFGLGGFEPGQLKEIFDLFRELRLAAGDFVPEEA